MSLDYDVFDIIEGIQRQQSRDGLTQYLNEALGPHGIEYISVIAMGPEEGEPLVFVIEQPTEWWDRYRERNYARHDPVLKALRESKAAPVLWSKIEASKEKGTAPWQIFVEANEYGLCGGVTIPILGPKGLCAAVSFVGPLDDGVDRASNHLKALELIAHFAYRQLLMVTEPGDGNGEGTKLTLRERECLDWILKSKSYSETGAILTIAEETVRKHIENARKKFKLVRWR